MFGVNIIKKEKSFIQARTVEVNGVVYAKRSDIPIIKASVAQTKRLSKASRLR